jgi:Na+/melibiose symporter-like transporter
MFSFAPAIVLFLAILILYKYPLNRQRMEEIKGLLELRRQQTEAAHARVE